MGPPALLFNALPSLIAGHHSGLAGRGSSAQVVLHFLTIVKEVAAERNRLPTKALRTLGEDAHRPLGLPIACPFWTVQNIFSILTWMLARGEPRMYLCSVSGSRR